MDMCISYILSLFNVYNCLLKIPPPTLSECHNMSVSQSFAGDMIFFLGRLNTSWLKPPRILRKDQIPPDQIPPDWICCFFLLAVKIRMVPVGYSVKNSWVIYTTYECEICGQKRHTNGWKLKHGWKDSKSPPFWLPTPNTSKHTPKTQHPNLFGIFWLFNCFNSSTYSKQIVNWHISISLDRTPKTRSHFTTRRHAQPSI